MHAESQVVPGAGRGFLSFGREVVWSEEKRIGNQPAGEICRR